MSRTTTFVVVLALVAFGCSGDESMSAGDYFDAVEAETERFGLAVVDISDKYQAELRETLTEIEAAIEEDPNSAAALGDRASELAISAAASLLTDQQAELARYADALEALEPPGDIRSAHDEAVAAGRAAAEAIPATVALIEALTDVETLAAAVTGSPFGDAQLRLTASCERLQGLAADHGIETELRCPGGVGFG